MLDRGRVGVFVSTMVLAVVAGCGGPAGYPFDPIERYSVAPPTFRHHVYRPKVQLGLTMAPATTQPLDRPKVLVLSGGGSNGAWGAGFLVGWGSTGKRPTFDVVTGVSTGALIATAAFIGDDRLLTEAFTNTDNDDIQRDRCLLTILFSDSARKSWPLARSIERFFPDAVLDKVAAAAADNRKLYIASTDLNTGKLVIWDLTRVAADHQYGLYRQLVLSSASAPVLYPPVRVGKDLFVDGGIRASLFYRTYLLDPTAARAKPQIFAINNGAIGVGGDSRLDDAIIPIGLRSLDCLLDANGNDSLLQLNAFGGDVNLSYIPSSTPSLTSFDFDKQKMQALFTAGQKDGRGPVWRPAPNEDEILNGKPATTAGE